MWHRELHAEVRRRACLADGARLMCKWLVEQGRTARFAGIVPTYRERLRIKWVWRRINLAASTARFDEPLRVRLRRRQITGEHVRLYSDHVQPVFQCGYDFTDVDRTYPFSAPDMIVDELRQRGAVLDQ